MDINEILYNVINNSKDEKLVAFAKSWLLSEHTDNVYKPDNVVQVLSRNWEQEILNEKHSNIITPKTTQINRKKGKLYGKRKR